MTLKDNQKNDNKVPEKHSKNYEDEKSKIDKEIEAELLEYLNRDKTNEKKRSRKRKIQIGNVCCFTDYCFTILI